MRQNEKRRLRNRMVKTRLRNLRKKVMSSESAEEAGPLLREAYKLYDRATHKGTIHKNKAAREKSRLAALLNKKFS
jgi:small subunit ribosomal protein S20